MAALDKRRIFPTSVVVVRWLSSRSPVTSIGAGLPRWLSYFLDDISRNLGAKRPTARRSEKCAFVAAGAVDTGAVLSPDFRSGMAPSRVELSRCHLAHVLTHYSQETAKRGQDEGFILRGYPQSNESCSWWPWVLKQLNLEYHGLNLW